MKGAFKVCMILTMLRGFFDLSRVLTKIALLGVLDQPELVSFPPTKRR